MYIYVYIYAYTPICLIYTSICLFYTLYLHSNIYIIRYLNIIVHYIKVKLLNIQTKCVRHYHNQPLIPLLVGGSC